MESLPWLGVLPLVFLLGRLLRHIPEREKWKRNLLFASILLLSAGTATAWVVKLSGKGTPSADESKKASADNAAPDRPSAAPIAEASDPTIRDTPPILPAAPRPVLPAPARTAERSPQPTVVAAKRSGGVLRAALPPSRPDPSHDEAARAAGSPIQFSTGDQSPNIGTLNGDLSYDNRTKR
jgi:hypothetical protein